MDGARAPAAGGRLFERFQGQGVDAEIDPSPYRGIPSEDGNFPSKDDSFPASGMPLNQFATPDEALARLPLSQH